jgi:hypothetical protein
MFDSTPNRLDAVFVQRTPGNEHYEQINISASNAIVYLNEEGKIDVDPISAWAIKYNIGGGGNTLSSSWASSSLSSSYAETSSFAISASWAPGSTTPVSVSYASTSSDVPFNGNRSIKRNDPYFVGLNVGGDDVVEFLNNFFFPFIPSTVSITSPSSTIYYETGSVQSRAITSTITANDETIFGTGSVKRDGLIWNTIASIPPYAPSYTDTNISSSHTYQTFVQTDNDGSPTLISSTARSISFIFPYLYGMSSVAGLSGVTLYTAMVSHSIVPYTSPKADYFWGTGTYIYFCYPASYAQLSSILDPSSFQMYPSFEYSASVPVTSSGLSTDWMTNYKVYRLKLLASPSGYFQFI